MRLLRNIFSSHYVDRIIRMPKPPKRSKDETLRPSLPWSDLPKLFKKLGDSEVDRAIKLIALTGLRISEVLEATSDEFDFEKRRWVVPRHRMKARAPHLIRCHSAMK
jgi:integrase